MRKGSSSLLFLLAVGLVFSGFITSYAQSRERFVISAKAGGVNAVTGRTRVHAQGSAEWEQLTIKDNLEAGDVVKTGTDGRLEMLLNPGSYMRLAENSEFEMTNNSLDNLEVRLIRGTAIVEATGADDTELMINITTPHTKMAIVRRGLYRVNVVPGDVTELIVRKGRVLLSDSHTKVKGGKKLIFSGATYSVAKLEKQDKKGDDFDGWSKQRAEFVAQANRRITRRDLSLMLASFRDPWSRGFGNGYGVWLFNSRFGCYTFLPFSYGWGSPYGNSYSSPFFAGYYPGNSGGYGGYSGGNASGGSGGSGGYNPGTNPSSTPSQPPSSPPPSAPTRDFTPERSQPGAGGAEVHRPRQP